MRIYRQLSQLVDTMPVWVQLALAAFLVAYSIASIYGRININFGAKFFSRIPADQIREDRSHIFQYTVIPIVVTIGYFALLFAEK